MREKKKKLGKEEGRKEAGKKGVRKGNWEFNNFLGEQSN